jgi:heme exporter protein CcmB
VTTRLAAAPTAGVQPIAVGLLRQVATLAGKDLRVELRSREILYTMVFFAAIVVLVFSFAFVREGSPVGDVATGILWIAVAFSGTLGLSRAFDCEREHDTMRGLLLAPVPRAAIFMGKAVGIVVFMVVTEAVVVPLVGVLFRAELLARRPLDLVVVLLLATVGFAVVGSVFAAMLLRSRSRDVLLPVVLYPVLVPLLIAGTKATAALLETTPDLEVYSYWLRFLLVYDAIFAVVALWVFESLVIE